MVVGSGNFIPGLAPGAIWFPTMVAATIRGHNRQGFIVRPSVTTPYPWKLNIGDYSWIGDDVVLYSFAEITIGKDAVVSQKSYLCAGTHDYRSPPLTCKRRRS